MRNRKIALLIVGVYALSLIASVFTVQPVQAAVAAGYSEYFIPGSTDQLFRIIQDNDNNPDLGNQYFPASLSDWMGTPSKATLAQGISLPAEINKSFSPITIVAGQVSRLSVTIYNPNSFSLTNAAWIDNMPAGIFLADPVNSVTTCGGTVTGEPGANTFSLSGGTVPAQAGPNPGSCTVSVDVSSITPGNLINMIPANGLTSTGGGVSITNTTPASATLQVNAVQPPSLNKNFSPNTIWAGNTSVLTINILNNDLNNALTNVSLTDTMLPNVKLASPVGASLTNCGAGVLTAVSGNSTLTLSGASIPKSSICVIKVNVTSTVQGSYLNTIPASAIESAQGVTNAAAASAALNVQMLSVTKNFVATTLVAGSTTPLTITLSNPTNADYTGVHISDTLPAPFIIAAAPAPVNTCGGTLTAVPDTNLIDLTGGTIPRSAVPPAVSTCTITVTVTAPLSALTMGNQTNTIPAGSMTTDQGITNPSAATDQMAVQAALVAGKSFTPASISPGGTTTVTVTLRNHTAAAFTGVNLTDTLPAGLTVLGTPTTPQCGGVITNDATSVTITGGTIAAGATCTITFQVTASASGSLTNTIPVGSVTTAQGATNVTQASTTVTVASSALPVTSSKSFSPTTIVPGGNTRLRIDVRAPADSGLSNLSITDVLPAGMTVSNSTPPTISNCGASRVLTAPTGATSVLLTNGTVLAGQTCRIDVYVTTSTPGVSVNSIPLSNITYAETRPLTPPAPANLIVTGLSMSKAFYPPVVNPNGFSRLTITLTNTALARLINASLTDPLPTNVYVAAVPNAVSTCGGTVTAVANTQTISLTNGIIPAQVGAIAGVCTISVDVQGRGSAATRTNTIPVGNLSATIEGDGTVINPTAAATANLTIGNLHIVVNKAFNPLTVHGGSASVMSIELRNPDNAALSGIQFTDTMPAGMVIANPPNFDGGTCGAAPTGVIGSNVVTFSGGTLASASSCTMTLNVTMNVNGNLTNTIPVGAVTTFNGVANTSPAAASLTNLPGASVGKYFAESSIQAGPGSSTLLTITIQNTSAFALTGLGLIDNMPTGLQVSPAPAPVNNCTGTLTALPGTQLIQLSGGTLAGNSTCTLVVPVNGPLPGVYTNTIPIGALTNNEGTTNTEPATDTLTLTGAPALNVTKTLTSTGPLTLGSTLTYDIIVENTGNIALSDVTVADLGLGVVLGACSPAQPASLAPGAIMTCVASHVITQADIDAGSYTNTATADSAETPTDTDSETVTIPQNVLPDISVLKTASVPTVAETGGSVTFTYTVTNNSAEAATITSLSDDRFGALSGDADCQVGTVLPGNATCSFSAAFNIPAGNADGSHINTFTATVRDNEGSTDTAEESETVTYTNVVPDISVTKTAGSLTLPETGGSVTYTFTVTNNSSEPVTISSLTDDAFGILAGDADCQVKTVLAGGASCSFEATFVLDAADADDTHTNIFTAVAADDEGGSDTASDDATVTYTDVLPVITVIKDVDPAALPEEGGPATFTYNVTNDSGEPVEITALVDGTFGPLAGDADCQVGTVLDPGESCTFEATFPIPAGDAGDTHVSDFTAQAEDNEDNLATDTDDATVTYTDTPPSITVTKTADQTSLPETGNDVTFTFLVENTGLEAVTLTSLVDDVFGNLNGKGTCSVPQIIAVGGSHTCQFNTTITGDSLVDHVNTVTAEAIDNDGSTATDNDTATIAFTDVQPVVAITKTANPASVPETGGAVTFTFVVENTGQEAVTLTSLVDNVFGNLNGQGTCIAPQTIAVGGSYSCSITRIISGDTTDSHANTVTAAFGDNDGNTSSTSDGAVVTFTDVAPEITVLKTAGATDVPETGGSVTYTYTVTNAGAEPVTINSLADDPLGLLAGDADCQVGTVLAGGESCSFDSTFVLDAADAGDTHTNTFTAVASDNEGGSDTATDDETVTYTDVEPQIAVLKTASVSEVAETGGDVTFTYTVTNLGAEPAMIAFLYDDPFGELEGNADCNYTTTLAGGASCSFEATFTLPAGEPGGTHVDLFTASIMDDEENFAEASEDETVTYTNLLPDVSVLKTAAVSEVVETGENVTFTFTVTNNSLEDAAITELSDDQFGTLAGDADCQAGTVLAGGASCTFDAVLAIPAGAVGSTHVNIFTAVVEDNDGSSDSASESETITFTATPVPAITVLKEVFADGSWWDANTTPGPEIRYGQSPQFRFTVRNTGNVTLTGITLSDSLYDTASCTIPASLLPNDGVGGSGTDEFSCTITAPWVLGQHTNTATASANYGATPVSASDDANYVGVNNTADLAVTKTDGVATYTPGGLLTYTIVVINNGPDPVTGATFTDLIPAQIARWTWTCAQAGGASGCTGVTNSTVNFTNTIDLPVGGAVTYTVTATTRASATTALTNTASVTTPTGTDDTNPGNNSATDVDTAAPRVNLSLNKAVDGQFRAGANLAYTLTVTNNGPSDAANVIVSDMLPGEVTYVSATPAIASGPNPVTWNLGTLASGASRSIRLVVRVKDWVNQPFTNTATVTSATPEISVTDNSDAAVADPEEPTPVTLLYFRAAPADGLNVLVEWKAETEVDHFAYKIYRSTTPVFADAVELIIVEPNTEKTYSHTDTVPAAGNYYYWLVDISTTNAIEVHEPVLVIFNALRFYLPVVGR